MTTNKSAAVHIPHEGRPNNATANANHLTDIWNVYIWAFLSAVDTTDQTYADEISEGHARYRCVGSAEKLRCRHMQWCTTGAKPACMNDCKRFRQDLHDRRARILLLVSSDTLFSLHQESASTLYKVDVAQEQCHASMSFVPERLACLKYDSPSSFQSSVLGSA
jgi:hypothetical protein